MIAIESSASFFIRAVLSGLIISRSTQGQNEKQVHPGFLRQFRDGDVIIGGAMEIHRHSPTGDQCGELRSNGVQDIETINMLIDQVNANDSILRGVKLGSVMIDTCQWPMHALQQIVKQIIPFVQGSGNCSNNITKKRVLAGMIGAGTSKVSLQMTNLLNGYSIPQISHSSTSQDLSDKELYPYFFRTVAPDVYQSRALVQFAAEMKWNYISLVYENDCYGRNAYLEFTTLAKKHNICIATSISISQKAADDNYTMIAQKLLKNKASNVVIVYAKSTQTEKVILAAKSLSKDGGRLMWVGSDSWATYLPKNQKDASYSKTLDGAVGIRFYGSHQDSVDRYMTNITLGQRQGEKSSVNPWFSELLALEKGCVLTSGGKSSAKECKADDKLDSSLKSYDTLFNMVSVFQAFVHSLDSYHRQICGGKSGFCREMSDFAGTNKLAFNIRSILKNISFPLSNGDYFSFDRQQDGPPNYDIMVYDASSVVDPNRQRQGWVRAGSYENGRISWINGPPAKAFVTESVCSKKCGIGQGTIKDVAGVCCWTCIDCNSTQFVSPNSSLCESCPVGETSNKDRNGCVPLPIKAMDYREVYSTVPLALGVFGVVLTIIVTIIYCLHRCSPIITASGKELCFFVLFGVLLTFCNCFVLTLPSTTRSCVASRTILAIGPAVMYAGLFVKTLRVVIIFNYKTDLPRRIESSLLPFPQIMITLGFVLVQVIFFAAWWVVETPEPWVQYDLEKGFLSCPGMTNPMIFIGLVYPFFLIVVCTVLATMNINVPTGFNETLHIGFTMYTTCVIWLAFLPLFNINMSNVPLKITTTSVSLSLSALTVLCCLFAPRCFKVLFRPEENTRHAVMSKPRSLDTSTI